MQLKQSGDGIVLYSVREPIQALATSTKRKSLVGVFACLPHQTRRTLSYIPRPSILIVIGGLVGKASARVAEAPFELLGR